MPIAIWTQCQGPSQIKLLNETAWRLVNAQERTSTRKLVDSFEEQMILEEMMESHKLLPPNDFHPLLYTPFKNPPLIYGSRFSNKMEPSLWYGSLQLETAMAEKAFYRFNFLRASQGQYGIVEQLLTGFSVRIKTEKGIQLIDTPFSNYTKIISSPISYEASQTLGTVMREANIEGFTYQSARGINNAVNIALFTPKAFLHKNLDKASFKSWACVSHGELIEFIDMNSIFPNKISFSLHQFMVDNTLPFPVN